MTSLTELHMTVPFAHKHINVQGLACLQCLHLDYKPDSWNDPETTYHPFLFPEAATITKLHLVITDKVTLRLRAKHLYSVSMHRNLEAITCHSLCRIIGLHENSSILMSYWSWQDNSVKGRGNVIGLHAWCRVARTWRTSYPSVPLGISRSWPWSTNTSIHANMAVPGSQISSGRWLGVAS